LEDKQKYYIVSPIEPIAVKKQDLDQERKVADRVIQLNLRSLHSQKSKLNIVSTGWWC
jgi:hypothetical protein